MPPNLVMARAKEAKMSNSKYELECFEVLTSFVILVDADVAEVEIELQFQNMPQLTLSNINSHLSSCVPCSTELVHERAMRDLTRDALRRSCNEEAPSDLHEALGAMFNQANFAGFKNEVITEFSMHEVTIEIDEFGNIEHREIRVEGRTEYRNEEDK
jgi:hypothetical protein